MSSRSPLVLVPSAELAEISTALPAVLSSEISREAVLERVDVETLQSAPLNFLISTALAIAPADSAALAEDMLLRQTTALTESATALAAHARIAAEALALVNLEYQAATQAYAAAELEAPVRSEWKNPQHYLEACKVHERRMDRLGRMRKEVFERLERAGEIYRTALLTRDGLDTLKSVEVGPRSAAQAVSSDGKNICIIVQ